MLLVHFTTSIPAPLVIGKVELADGSEVPGFLCEAYTAKSAEKITSLGGWLFLASRKCMKWQLKMHTYTCQIPWLTLRD